MKLSGNFTGRLATLAAAIVAVTLVNANAQPKQGNAVAKTVSGDVSYSDGSGVWKTLKSGKSLGQGTTIRTSGGSEAVLYLGENGPWVQLTPGTTLGIDNLSYEKIGDTFVIDTRLDLKAGRVLGKVKKTSSSSKYEVKTPVSVVGIRGTDYDISANGKVAIDDGQGVVVHVNPDQTVATHLVPSGNTFDPGTGTVRPSTPGELMPVVIPTPTPGREDALVFEERPFLPPHPDKPVETPINED